jgi:hypothetical protein
MSPEAQVLVKVIAGTALVVALVLSLIERLFRPATWCWNSRDTSLLGSDGLPGC